MPGNDPITLVIHTPRRAAELKKILSEYAVRAELVPLSIKGMDLPDAVKVNIDPVALPVALKILESGGAYSSVKADLAMSGSSGQVLIPVDFSLRAGLACEVGFGIAERLHLHPVLIHAFSSPKFPLETQFDGGDFSFLEEVAADEAVADAEIETQHRQARMLKSFVAKIKQRQKEGSLPDIEFSASLLPGVPEEVIAEYCRQTPPALVVMATRGVNRKATDLIGSVTAEVLDSCRVPVFALPEDYDYIGIREIKNLLFFCNLDRQDVISIDSLMRMFDYPDVNISIVPISERRPSMIVERLSSLCKYLSSAYPNVAFSRMVFPQKTFRQDLEKYIAQMKIQLLVVPNKKTNIFRRLFRPGIAHKLLFEGDMPMLAFPV